MFGFGKSKKISQKEAKEQLDKDDSIIVIDVRDDYEFANGHIKNAINIPMSKLVDEIEGKVPDKKCKIFVNCLSGGRSKASCSLLSAKGYENVFDIGGINSWEYGIER